MCTDETSAASHKNVQVDALPFTAILSIASPSFASSIVGFEYQPLASRQSEYLHASFLREVIKCFVLGSVLFGVAVVVQNQHSASTHFVPEEFSGCNFGFGAFHIDGEISYLLRLNMP